MFIFSSIRVLPDKRVEINLQYFGLSVLIYALCKMWIVQGKTFQNYIYNNYSCTFLWICSLVLRVNYAKQIYGCDLNEKII